jgi:hypothetical protein
MSEICLTVNIALLVDRQAYSYIEGLGGPGTSNGVQAGDKITASVFPFRLHRKPDTVSLPLYVHVHVNDSWTTARPRDGDNITLFFTTCKSVI